MPFADRGRSFLGGFTGPVGPLAKGYHSAFASPWSARQLNLPLGLVSGRLFTFTGDFEHDGDVTRVRSISSRKPVELGPHAIPI